MATGHRSYCPLRRETFWSDRCLSTLTYGITRLDQAIATQDQKSAVNASNTVGLAVPELFDYFHPDAPSQIVRMDAVFRQAGIDAHFGQLSAAAQDVGSLKTDWAASKATVDKRVPTCHRVANTANVVGDIEQSLG